ncbi:hydrogenase maturation nickel metallochaperone HypA [Halogeometricum limi]|uniref:DUF7130 domain-containing protein n=1 Tax=Halogeometricum limi TaxID=555875 RepID=A0A1I6HI90_9EURY|nr:hydrogenase maturation nickel metallochaperone HypA [Halogeometricum limi]SFR54185.1 hypothetical protein SAMN04488124_2279 [Halogeometricum limi]
MAAEITQQSTKTARTETPVRPAEPDAQLTPRPPETSAETTSRAVLPGVTLPNKRIANQYFGESYLVWRCADCGETGSLAQFPVYCPDCNADREALFYWLED